MSFGLTNAPSMFIRLMNDIPNVYLGKFVIVYLDNILILAELRKRIWHTFDKYATTTGRKVVSKIEKVRFHERRVNVFGICALLTRVVDGAIKGQPYTRMVGAN